MFSLHDDEVVAVIAVVCLMVLVLPILALSLAIGARRKTAKLIKQIEALTNIVDHLKKTLEGKITPSPTYQEPVYEPPSEKQPTPTPVEFVPQGDTPSPAGLVVQATSVSSPSGASDTSPSSEPTPPAAPEASLPPPPATRKPLKPSAPGTIEERIGLVWFTRVGALIGILAAGWFFKYMVDNEWIGPWAQITCGILAGFVLLGLAEWMSRGRTVHPLFFQGLMGLGLALLVVTAYASFGFYHLVPATVAFMVVALLSIFGCALSVHQHSQPILILSMIAAFLNPVALSTGVDRPFALFAYLLVITSGVLLVSTRLNFRVAAWVALTGTAVLFAGWYGRFFNATPPPPPGVYDQLPEELQGAYFPLSARWAALLFAGLFPLQWVLTGIGYRRRNHTTTALTMVLAAAIGAHVAATALLFDHPVVLGGALCFLGVAFGILMVRESWSDWLGIPMIASFVALLLVVNKEESQNLLPMLGVSGVLAVIYFGVTVRSALKAGRLSASIVLWLLCGAGLGLAITGAFLLLPHHIVGFAALLVALSAVFLTVAVLARSVFVLAGSFVLSFFGLLGSDSQVHETQIALLVVVGLWFIIYIGFIAYDLFVNNAPWTNARLAILAGAGIGFAGLIYQLTPYTDEIVRALLSLATGLVYLIFGSRMRTAQTPEKDRSLLPLGLALVFFTLALALLFPGFTTLTVIWAIEGTVLAFIASRSVSSRVESLTWLTASWILFCLSFLRLVTVDLQYLAEQRELFTSSLGKIGMLLPTAFLHPRAYALLVLGAALLMSARFLSKAGSTSSLRISAAINVIAAHAAWLALLVSEIRILATHATVPMIGLPADEFEVALGQFDEALSMQSNQLDMVTTVVFGVYAVLLLVAGFGLRNKLHRLLGLCLFGLALGKLGLWDIWSLETIYKIVVGATIAALMLLGAFLYGRFGNRIKNILSDQGQVGMLLLAVGCLCFTANNIKAGELSSYEQRSEIQGVTAPGDYRLEIGQPVYAASRHPEELTDLRIAAPDGNEVPFVHHEAVAEVTQKVVSARLLDPVILPNGSLRVLLDLGARVKPHHALMLEIEGHDYLRRTKVESSLKGREFGLLAQGGYVFDVSAGEQTSRHGLLQYPTTNARYLRITILPGSDKNDLQVSEAYLPMEQHLRGPSMRTVSLSLLGPPSQEQKKTIINLERLPSNVPFIRLTLAIDEPEFVRRVRVEATTRQQAWFEVGGGVIYRVTDRGTTPARVDESLDLPIQPGGRPLLRLVFENGDDPPLSVRAVSASYLMQEIVFRTRTAGPHMLYIGRADAREPQYDLAEVISRSGLGQLQAVKLGPLQPNPEHVTTAPDKTVPWTEHYSTELQIGIGVLVLLLGAWTVKLLRRESPPPGGAPPPDKTG
jgi:hypothetical protein